MKIVGRKKETKELMRLYRSNKPELIAIYGRRGVGKTFLINNLFADKIVFSHTGVSPDDLEKSGKKRMGLQLSAFYGSLLSQGMRPSKKPSSWIEAFTLLIEFLESKKNGQRQVVFIDELPWIDTVRSNFISSFGWFWNQWACKQKDIMLIICGSATSWINDHLINAHGGLYNRLTYTICLAPFSLKESLDYLSSKNIKTSKYKVAMIDMVLGGIPYYLEYYQENLSIEKNIDNFFFKDDAKLRSEFDNLFSSTFTDDKLTKRIVIALAKRNKGYTRKELLQAINASDGEAISKCLKALKYSSFIIEYVPFMEKKNKRYYKIVDPFCLFYLKFVYNQKSLNKDMFFDYGNSSWAGLAFENLCLYHLSEIKSALGISSVSAIQFSWCAKESATLNGAQIDLLIERKDNIISLCEMKFYNKEFKVDKQCHFNLMNKIEQLASYHKKKYTIIPTLITTFGLKKSDYFDDFGAVVTLDDLFTE